MPVDTGANQASASDTPLVTDPPASAPSPSTTLQGGFFKRLYGAYVQELHEDGANEPEAPRRIPPAPLSSPPFPTADWNYGGSSVIGATNTANYPLMRAIYAGPNGEAWKASGVQVYGWIDPGFNLSTSKHSNLPAGYDIIPNRPELDQFVTYIERVPDTVQTSHVDWGFRAANFFGIDYHFTTAEGWLSQQLLKQHRLYGDDPVNLYGEVYFPKVAQGLNVRFGRYISLPDIEAQLSPQNYMYSHSLLYSYDPFTQTGLINTLKVNDRWLVNLGISAGNDIAPWARGAKASLTACVSYTFNNGQRQHIPLCQRHKQRQVRLQQRAVLREYLVSQVQRFLAYGHRGVLRVPERCAQHLRLVADGAECKRSVLCSGPAGMLRRRMVGSQLPSEAVLKEGLHLDSQRVPR
jgi:hypothetical protein